MLGTPYPTTHSLESLLPTSPGLPPGSLTGAWSEEVHAWVAKYLACARDPTKSGGFEDEKKTALIKAFGRFHDSYIRHPTKHHRTDWHWRDVTDHLPSPGTLQRLGREANGDYYQHRWAADSATVDSGQTLADFLKEAVEPLWLGEFKRTANAAINLQDWGMEWNERIFDLGLYSNRDKDSIFFLFSNPTMPKRLREAAIESYAYGAENPAMSGLWDEARAGKGFGDWAQEPAMQGLVSNPATTRDELLRLRFLLDDAVLQTKENFVTHHPVQNYFSSLRNIQKSVNGRLAVKEATNFSGYGDDHGFPCVCGDDWKKTRLAEGENQSTDEIFDFRLKFIASRYSDVSGAGFDERLIFNSFNCSTPLDDSYRLRSVAATTVGAYFKGGPWFPSPHSFPWVAMPALAHLAKLEKMRTALDNEDIPLEWVGMLLG